MHTLSGLEERILVKLAGEAGNGFEKLEMIRTIEEGKKFELEMAIAHENPAESFTQDFSRVREFLDLCLQ